MVQLRRIGSYRGIEYIVRLTDSGLRYSMVDSHGLTSVVCEKGTELPSHERTIQYIDYYLDFGELEWE